MSSRRRLAKAARDRDRVKQAVGSGRQVVRLPQSRGICSCCGTYKTHAGTENGVAMISGCALRVRRWSRGDL